MTGRLCQQQRKAVLHLVYLFFQIEHGSLHLIVRGLHLRHGGFVRHARIHQGTGGSNGFPPRLFGLPGDGKLLVQHQQGIVSIGYPGNELGTHGLEIVLTLRIERLRLFLGIAHAAENIQLPTGSNGQRIGLCGLAAVKAAHRALRRKGKGGQEGKLCGQQGGFSLFHAELCRLVVGIVLQPLSDECLQMWVGEKLVPVHAAQAKVQAVFGGSRRTGEALRKSCHFFPIEAVGDLGSGFVFGVHAATAEQQTGGGQ